MKDIGLSTIGCRALDSHVESKKHHTKLKQRMQGLDLFFKWTVIDQPSSLTSCSHEIFSSSKTVTSNLDELLSCLKCRVTESS